MRLIDADALEYHEIDEIGGEYNPYLGCSKEYIDRQPTVDVLDKVRAEIEQAKLCKVKTNDGREIIASADFVVYPNKRNYTNGLETALQIIDKYIKEE